MVGQLGLRARRLRGAAGARSLLSTLRCIQLDPLDPMGTNADLVALARVDGIGRGDVYRHLLPRHAFEHFAKERCLLPASAFPQYRERAAETPWWRSSERMRRLPPSLVEDVLAEVRSRGPVATADLAERGRVRPLDWHGWKGTAKSASMALEVLWTQCRIVVCGRGPRGKIYDVPERALPHVHDLPAVQFEPWSLLERVEAAGLLARAGGPCWSMLSAVRTSSLPDELIASGQLEDVLVEGSSRPYLAPAGFRDRRFPRDDGRMRILGPLDPLLWDRKLVEQVFRFDYVWEVYKPEHQRRWGWYVCPLLHRGRLVGRIEARAADGALKVQELWPEPGVTFDRPALGAALTRHATACGVGNVRWRGAGR